MSKCLVTIRDRGKTFQIAFREIELGFVSPQIFWVGISTTEQAHSPTLV